MPGRGADRGRCNRGEQADPGDVPETDVGDAVDVAEQLGERAIVDRGDGGAQDDRAEDVGAVDDAVGEDREAGEDFR